MPLCSKYRLILCFCLIITFVSLGYGAKIKVLEVKIYNIYEEYLPYSSRNKPAERIRDGHDIYLKGATEIGTMLIAGKNYKKRIKFVLEEASKQGADFFFLSEDIVQVKKSYYREAGSYTYWLGAKDDYSRVKITNRTYEKKDKYIDVFKYHLIRIIPEEADGALWQGFRDCLDGCAVCDDGTRSPLDECNYCKNFVLEEYLKKGCDPNDIDYLGVPNLYRFFNCILELPKYITISWYIDLLETDYTKLKILLDAGTDPNILPSKINKERDYSIPDILMEVNPPYPSLLKLVKNKIKERKLEIEILHDKNKRDYEVTKAHLDFLIKIENLLVEYGARE